MQKSTRFLWYRLERTAVSLGTELSYMSTLWMACLSVKSVVAGLIASLLSSHMHWINVRPQLSCLDLMIELSKQFQADLLGSTLRGLLLHPSC